MSMSMDDQSPSGDAEQSGGQATLPSWALVIHSVDYASIPYVETCLINTVRALSLEQATEITYEAHVRGRARVVTCPLEVAEFYRERLESLVLRASIERA